jgi:hypothetical protein
MTTNLIASPKHEALWPTDLFEQGVGWIIVARFKSGGQRVEAGIFLVDVFCRGVKLACYEDCQAGDYRERIRHHYLSHFPMATVEPWCARKLVEQATEYARALGLPPHPDYKKAARVFGGINPEQCAQQFTFGYQGKPFYRRGPHETEAEALEILRLLKRRCGKGNFEYDVLLGEATDIQRFLDA